MAGTFSVWKTNRETIVTGSLPTHNQLICISTLYEHKRLGVNNRWGTNFRVHTVVIPTALLKTNYSVTKKMQSTNYLSFSQTIFSTTAKFNILIITRFKVYEIFVGILLGRVFFSNHFNLLDFRWSEFMENIIFVKIHVLSLDTVSEFYSSF